MQEETLRDVFTALIEELRNAPEIVLLGAELGPPAAAEALARLETWFGGRVPDDVRAFYAEVGAVQIRWMAAKSPRYVGREDEYPRGAVPWTYALFDTLENKKEDGVLVLPPLDVVIERSWENLMDDVDIWIDGEIDEGPQIEPGDFDRSVRIFDFSSFYDWPGFFRATGRVGVGTDHGIDWSGERHTFREHLDDALDEMRGRIEAARRGDTSF
ncbi:hypothetical protein [Polyangium sp. 6x1]|uniref:hypothetical protein n=1 Tax=Polyangium sp. 6x1 TaxID=3042689 RepID=UPI00248315F7|nr:hypothetical protein [Polyangium sp. 6x1]MDI1451035.1 hypothetical protein [Polyangium sp. 6x1]